MSRIGLKPIVVPAGVEVILGEENFVEVKGPKGKLNQQLSREMNIKMEGNTISIERPSEIKRHKSLHGLTRTLLAAKFPSFCLSIPLITIFVGSGTSTVIPSGSITSIGWEYPKFKVNFFPDFAALYPVPSIIKVLLNPF